MKKNQPTTNDRRTILAAPHAQNDSGRHAGPAATTRLFHLHEKLAVGTRFTVATLARELEISERTVKRDIERLRDFHRAPIIWEPGAKTYRYSEPFDLLTGLRLNANETLAIVLAGHTFSAWGGSPLGRILTHALGKIARFAGDAISLPADLMRECLFTPAEEFEIESGSRWFAPLLECILRQQVVTLRYRKPSSARPESRRVHPLHLACLDHRWMLIAHDEQKSAWRSFLLDRIHGLERTGKHFAPPPRTAIRNHLKGSLGRFTGEKEIEVLLNFSAIAAPYVRERPWHFTQHIEERPDGSIQVRLRLNNLVDIQRRILANGRHVEVLEPPDLRVAVAAEAALVSKKYH
ncbi:MAG: transcriptional regulator [Opitutaceae bacterium]|nr:transcriptional regulator [Opitutaceae bacterium]